MKTAILLTAALVAAGASNPNTKAPVPQDDPAVLTIADRLPTPAEPIVDPVIEPVAFAPKANCENGQCSVGAAKEAGPVRSALKRDGEGPIRRVFQRRERGGFLRGRCRGC